jgi:hypothetical protein
MTNSVLGRLPWPTVRTWFYPWVGIRIWRLPDVKELRSIVDNTRYNPAIDPIYFPGTESAGYWPSSTYAPDTTIGWYLDFRGGAVDYGHEKPSAYHVRCVR